MSVFCAALFMDKTCNKKVIPFIFTAYSLSLKNTQTKATVLRLFKVFCQFLFLVFAEDLFPLNSLPKTINTFYQRPFQEPGFSYLRLRISFLRKDLFECQMLLREITVQKSSDVGPLKINTNLLLSEKFLLTKQNKILVFDLWGSRFLHLIQSKHEHYWICGIKKDFTAAKM